MDSEDMVQLVIFTLGRGLYGVDVSQVREITNLLEVTPVPGAPHYVNGVTNLRGQVTTVIDLKKKLELPEDEGKGSRIIIVEPEGVPIGMVVDSVSEVRRLPIKEVEDAPEPVKEQATSEYIKGVGKLEDGRLLTVIDLQKLFSQETLVEA